MSERPQLNVRVPKKAKEQYEQEILDKYGFTESYAGFELENELRRALGMGEESAMYDHLRELVDNPTEKKNLKPSVFGGEDTTVQYRIHPEVKSKLKEATRRTTTTQKDFVTKVMGHYTLGEGYQDRERNWIQDLKEEATKKDGDLSATERKERDIAEYLKENIEVNGFIEIGQFDEAVKEATGLKTMSHAREQYLQDVMDRLGVSIDPRKLPNDARDRSQKKAVIKAKTIEDPRKGRGVTFITSTDAIDELGKTTKQEVRSLMKEIGNTSGFSYVEHNSKGPLLELKDSEAVGRAKGTHETALRLVYGEGFFQESERESDDVQDPTGGDPTEANSHRVGVIAD